MHALARDIGPGHAFAALGHLVELVEKHDAVLLDVLDGAQLQLLVVDPLGGFFVFEQLSSVADAQLATLHAPLAEVLEEPLKLIGHLLHAGRGHDLDPHRRGGDLDLDLALVEFAGAQSMAKFFAGRRAGGRATFFLEARGWREECVEDALLRGGLGLPRELRHLLLARELDPDVGQVANDGLDIAPDIADLGEFGRLHL